MSPRPKANEPVARAESVAAYIRVSTEDQAEKYSLTSQEERIRDYCKVMRFPEPVFYSDDESGKSMAREEFDQLQDDVRACKFTRVVFLRVGRVARNTRGFLAVVEDVFMQHGCKVTCIEQPFDSGTPMGRFVMTLMAAQAQLEGEQITERTREGKHAVVKEEGTWFGGTTPYGYRTDKDGTGILRVDEEEKRMVLRVFALAQTGMSLRGIARTLDKEGFRPRPVKRRKQLEQTLPGKFSAQAISNILDRKEFYRGNDVVTGVDGGLKVAPKHEAILP